jgi:hypothetical protein
MEATMCDAARVNGVPMCKTHDRKLVNRETLDSLNIKREHPPVGTAFCPVSGEGFAFNADADEFLTPR